LFRRSDFQSDFVRTKNGNLRAVTPIGNSNQPNSIDNNNNNTSGKQYGEYFYRLR
jgi:hypothetical protein